MTVKLLRINAFQIIFVQTRKKLYRNKFINITFTNLETIIIHWLWFQINNLSVYSNVKLYIHIFLLFKTLRQMNRIVTNKKND